MAAATGRTNQGRRRTSDWGPRFLGQLALTRGDIKAACLASGVGRRTVYDRRDADPEFARALSDAIVAASGVRGR